MYAEPSKHAAIIIKKIDNSRAFILDRSDEWGGRGARVEVIESPSGEVAFIGSANDIDTA